MNASVLVVYSQKLLQLDDKTTSLMLSAKSY